MRTEGRVALGSLAGAAVGALLAPLIRPLFHPPTGGVGLVTVIGYPKSWDYAVIALLIGCAFLGGAIVGWRVRPAPEAAAYPITRRRHASWITAAAVFVLMLFIHDTPYALIDPFHEGEHLVAGWLMKSGERPYHDFYIFHGLAADAGLDAMALGDPPSPRRVRRQQLVLDALTLALLVPIAAELTATTAGLVGAVFLSLCATAALWLPVFPYYRLLPVLLAVWGLLRYLRSQRAGPLLVAFVSAGLGVLWSLDTGMFAVMGVAACVIALRVPLKRALLFALIAIIVPLIVLLAVRADIRQFVVDSFVIMPKAIDAVWSLPAPARPFSADGLRYYLPPVFYGFLFAAALVAWRRGERELALRIFIVALFSALLFRTAAGRVSWSHTRFSMPLLGIAVVAFVFEPLLRRRHWICAALLALPLFFYFEVVPNVAAGAKLLAGWRGRQKHEGLVAYPFATGKGVYTTPQDATDLAAMNGFIHALSPDGPIFDFSNERALYYLLQRKPSTRCMEVSMLSEQRMFDEAMAQLEARPPVCVIVEGLPAIGNFDGVTNRQRVPALAQWIDANYPKRTRFGRYVVASK